MKKSSSILMALWAVLGLSSGLLQAQDEKAPQQLPFYVYSDQGDHFIPSGFMGDTSDLTVVGMAKESPAKGNHCIKIKYSGKAAQGNKWAGVYWQDPANNWGTVKGAGYNLTGAKKLKFMARGDKGGEVLEFKSGAFQASLPIPSGLNRRSSP